ncbi:amidohydrolase family protein, partial [Puniceicoccales bacterium CK1056]|nr:amidohydrolase family protein [Oceanipulchritudo coccoides]
GQRGICTLPDGTGMDAWEFFRDNHSQAGTAAGAPAVADKIWFGGPILTMRDDAMRAEAIAEKAGEIIAVGPADTVLRHRGADTQMIDLAGGTLLPGFVDAHGHVFMIGVQALSANLLPAPDGEVNSIPDLQRIMRTYAETFGDRVQRAGLILGFGYDDSQLVEQRHPTRDELDAIASDIPVFVLHQS